jgi:predicted house-cleaning noncanonical NTP pyrophosphatase (MazG superfamily)
MRSKLVRDFIPDIVGMYGHVSGHRVTFQRIEGPELQFALEDKLQEEFAEFVLNPCAEELADLIEAATALTQFFPETAQVRKTKALQKGRFEEGWLMIPQEDSGGT